MAYYAVIEPPRHQVFTSKELEQNIAAIYQWRDFMRHFLKRPVPIQLFPFQDGIFIRMTDHEAYICLVGDNEKHQITRDTIPRLKNSLSDVHMIELTNWKHRQQQRMSSLLSEITTDSSIPKERLNELVLEIETEQDFINTRTCLPYIYYLKSYNPKKHRLVHQTETVVVNDEPYVITSVRDDMITIAIERFPNKYLGYVSEQDVIFKAHSDKLTYYKNVIPWEAVEFIEELLDELDMHPDRTFLSITGLSDNARLSIVNSARYNCVRCGEHPNVLYIPKLSSQWTEERVIELLKFFDPVGYKNIILKWWLSYQSNTYYMNLTIIFPPDRSYAGLFKKLFSPLNFNPPPSDADYEHVIGTDGGGTDGGADDVNTIYHLHPRLTKCMVSEHDVFTRMAILDLKDFNYSNIRVLYEEMTT